MLAFPRPPGGTNFLRRRPWPRSGVPRRRPGASGRPDSSGDLRGHRLRPAAVLLTHGHMDHVFSVTPVCRDSAGLPPAFITGTTATGSTNPSTSSTPAQGDVRPAVRPAGLARAGGRQALADGDTVTVAGIDLSVPACPGHVSSVMFGAWIRSPTACPDRLDRTMFTGDVVFAGSIRRTDLSGGNDAAMQRSLRAKSFFHFRIRRCCCRVTDRRRPCNRRSTNPYLRG